MKGLGIHLGAGEQSNNFSEMREVWSMKHDVFVGLGLLISLGPRICNVSGSLVGRYCHLLQGGDHANGSRCEG
jgi:hypothetical protein